MRFFQSLFLTFCQVVTIPPLTLPCSVPSSMLRLRRTKPYFRLAASALAKQSSPEGAGERQRNGLGWPMPIDNTNHFYQYQRGGLRSGWVLVGSLWVSQGRLITNVVGWIRGLIMKGKPLFIVKNRWQSLRIRRARKTKTRKGMNGRKGTNIGAASLH